MLPRHRIAATVHISSQTALDTVVTYISPASNDEGNERRGVFFVLIHVNEIDALVPWINTYVNYLNQTYDTAFKDDENITVERAVGIAHQKAKHKLQQIIEEARSLSENSISYCIGAVKGYDVHLATHGKNARAFLLHTLKTQYEEDSKYRWIDIGDGSEEESEDGGISIMSGRMQPKDTLFICSESVVDGLGLEALQKTISRASVDGAKIQLEKAVATVGGRVSYGALILRPTVEHIAAELPAYKSKSSENKHDSMMNLHHSEKTASELLDPKKHPSPFSGILSKLSNRKASTNEPKPIQNQSNSSNPFAVNSNRPINPRAKLSEVSQSGNRWVEKIVSYLHSLPSSSRRFLLIALLLGYLFTQSLVFLANRKTEEEQILDQQKTIEQIQDNLDQAESSLIFNNNEETARLLNEAESLLSDLPRETRTQEERHRLLSEELSALRQRLERVYETETQIIATVNFPANNIINQGENVVTSSLNGTFNLISNNGSVSNIEIPDLNTVSAELMSKDENGNIFITTAQSEVQLDLTNANLIVTPVNDNLSATDFDHYRDTLYALSATDQQIYRYNKIDGTFTNPNPWVNGNANVLAEATSMVIDGNVYVLTKTGEVFKYTRGAVQNWSVASTFGETEGMTKLVSPIGSPYLYALDTERNRIIMWEKEGGKLVNQFGFPDLGEIIDFDVRADNQLMYLLTNTEIATAAIVK